MRDPGRERRVQALAEIVRAKARQLEPFGGVPPTPLHPERKEFDRRGD
jgi:hypothetical protein